jgi:hypothetical protein
MKKSARERRLAPLGSTQVGFFAAIVLGTLLTARAQNPGALYATVVTVEGEPQIRSTTGELRPAVEGGRVRMGETVTSDADDGLQLQVEGPAGEDWGVLCPGPASEFVLDQYDLAAPPAQSQLQYLVVRFLQVVTAKITSWNPERFKVPTRWGGGGIRGTTFQLDSLAEDSITWTLWEGGPIDLFGAPDWGGFDDSFFSDPSQKGLETMLVQEFADAASLEGMDFLEYLSGGPSVLSLTDPSTSAIMTPTGLTGPVLATVAPAVCVPEGRWNLFSAGLLGLAFYILRHQRTTNCP